MKLESPEDLKEWYALSCPITGLRFDARTLELMDTDGDGRIRADEVKAAIRLLESQAAGPDGEDVLERQLAENLSKQSDLAKLAPSAADRKALADWEAAGKDSHIVISELTAEQMAAANAALAAVEPVVDAFFTPPDDMPLVTEAPDVELPLTDHLNPKHQEAILAFAGKCVKPVLGEKSVLSRLDWKAVKAAFAPYRAWIASKPVVNATAKDELVAEERGLRYRLHLEEFIANFVTMEALYGRRSRGDRPTEGSNPSCKGERSVAIFQTGILRIDGKELHLCFHVENEAAHAALAERSKCCVVYAKLTRPGEAATRQICAVVTAGTIAGLYVGRNGVFFDRDGRDWEAVVTKVVEAEVSLAEAFWSPWRKIGEGIAAAVKKFVGEKHAKALDGVRKGTESVQAGGAAMASSVAAVGIGIGMVGTAMAAIVSAVKGLHPWWMFFVAIAAIVLVVSVPSMVIAYFKLRKRDLGAILNASGWAINRPMRFSVKRARAWTKCAKTSVWKIVLLVATVALLAIAALSWYYFIHHKMGA